MATADDTQRRRRYPFRGEASISPALPGRGERAVVTAPGYLVREQHYRGEPIRLWPAADEQRIRQLVYVQGSTGAEIRLRRWEQPGLAIGLGAEGAVRVVVDAKVFAGLGPRCSLARVYLLGEVVTRADIVYPSQEAAMGHPDREADVVAGEAPLRVEVVVD